MDFKGTAPRADTFLTSAGEYSGNSLLNSGRIETITVLGFSSACMLRNRCLTGLLIHCTSYVSMPLEES